MGVWVWARTPSLGAVSYRIHGDVPFSRVPSGCCLLSASAKGHPRGDSECMASVVSPRDLKWGEGRARNVPERGVLTKGVARMGRWLWCCTGGSCKGGAGEGLRLLEGILGGGGETLIKENDQRVLDSHAVMRHLGQGRYFQSVGKWMLRTTYERLPFLWR